MNRHTSFWAMLLMSFFALSAVQVTDAYADRKRRKRKRSKQKANVKALRELMGPFKFGMTREQVQKAVAEQIKERYKEQMEGTSDLYVHDKLRAKQKSEVRKLKKSFTRFQGKKSGWDVSLIGDQFAHHTDESMLVYWETHDGKNQRRFFFFHDKELYKMVIALDTSKLADEQRNFRFFRSLMEKRFGRGKPHDTGLSWKLRDIHVDALNKLAIYSAFCLVMTQPRRAKALAKVRAKKAKKKSRYNSVIRTVVEDVDDGGPDLDEGADTIDRLIGDL